MSPTTQTNITKLFEMFRYKPTMANFEQFKQAFCEEGQKVEDESPSSIPPLHDFLKKYFNRLENFFDNKLSFYYSESAKIDKDWLSTNINALKSFTPSQDQQASPQSSLLTAKKQLIGILNTVFNIAPQTLPDQDIPNLSYVKAETLHKTTIELLKIKEKTPSFSPELQSHWDDLRGITKKKKVERIVSGSLWDTAARKLSRETIPTGIKNLRQLLQDDLYKPSSLSRALAQTRKTSLFRKQETKSAYQLIALLIEYNDNQYKSFTDELANLFNYKPENSKFEAIRSSKPKASYFFDFNNKQRKEIINTLKLDLLSKTQKSKSMRKLESSLDTKNLYTNTENFSSILKNIKSRAHYGLFRQKRATRNFYRNCETAITEKGTEAIIELFQPPTQTASPTPRKLQP
jgi:hypothetical protein